MVPQKQSGANRRCRPQRVVYEFCRSEGKQLLEVSVGLCVGFLFQGDFCVKKNPGFFWGEFSLVKAKNRTTGSSFFMVIPRNSKR